MATSSPQAQAHITVYASLPRSVTHGANIDLHPSNWEWVPCLTLPVMKLQVELNELHLSRRPYKWIRYAIGVVIGALGDLSTSPGLSETGDVQVVDYNNVLPANSIDLYYHTSNEEKRMMFPIDPNILHTRLTPSTTSQQRETFQEGVTARDGERCIWTGMGAIFCEVMHLVCHSKSDQYISTLTRCRGRGNENNIITEIDDVRNGLFLNRNACMIFGTELAFLMTPNFAINADDVDDTAEPDQRRYTTHVIQFNEDEKFPCYLITGSRCRIPDPVSPLFPPDILFDAIYAGFVLRHFGTEGMGDGIATKWKHHFYPDGPTATANIGSEESLMNALPRQVEAGERARSVPIDILAIPYLLVPPEELEAMWRAAREEEEAAEQKRVRDRVEEWASDTECRRGAVVAVAV